MGDFLERVESWEKGLYENLNISGGLHDFEENGRGRYLVLVVQCKYQSVDGKNFEKNGVLILLLWHRIGSFFE